MRVFSIQNSQVHEAEGEPYSVVVRGAALEMIRLKCGRAIEFQDSDVVEDAVTCRKCAK